MQHAAEPMAEMGERQTKQGGAGSSRMTATIVRWAAIAAGALGLLLAMGALPIKDGILAMEGWLQAFGLLGPVLYALIYAAAVVVFAPGLPLTVAAGIIFGGFFPQPWGILFATAVVVIGSNTGAASAFLIGRYLARDRVAAMAKQSGKFAAIDRAIQEGGWKIVALLRLSPAVPFNLQNYLYGLTPIRFWTCVATSIVAMLPGTFVYVYTGYLIRAGASASAQGGETNWGQLAMLVTGLIATFAVVIYIGMLAFRMLKQYRPELAESEQGENTQMAQEQPSKPVKWRGTVLTALVGLALLVGGCVAQANKGAIRGSLLGLFGPPAATLTEAYEPRPEGPSFDHSPWDAIVSQHVDERGLVDYPAIAENREALDAYIQKVANAPFDQMGRNEKLALLVNAYNAFTIELILDNYQTVKDADNGIKAIGDPWSGRTWDIGGHEWTLNEIEHEQIRPKFKDARIHFVLVCAAIGCPPLRTEAYTADQLEQQFEDQAKYVHNHDRWFRYDRQANSVHLTELYNWYGGDFKQMAGSVLKYAAQYNAPLKAALDAGNKPTTEWIDYDWSLNSQAHASRLGEDEK